MLAHNRHPRFLRAVIFDFESCTLRHHDLHEERQGRHATRAGARFYELDAHFACWRFPPRLGRTTSRASRVGRAKGTLSHCVHAGKCGSQSQAGLTSSQPLACTMVGSLVHSVSRLDDDCPRAVLQLAVKQSTELRSALEFFATAHSFRDHSLESVN